jgi:hypothetical protein
MHDHYSWRKNAVAKQKLAKAIGGIWERQNILHSLIQKRRVGSDRPERQSSYSHVSDDKTTVFQSRRASHETSIQPACHQGVSTDNLIGSLACGGECSGGGHKGSHH